MTEVVQGPPVLRDIMEEHLEELSFLWQVWQDSLFDRDVRHLHLSRMEGRIEAHTDGLREGRESAQALARDALGADDWSDVTAACWCLLHRDGPLVDPVVSALDADEPPIKGLRIALRHVARETTIPIVRPVTSDPTPSQAAIAADVFVFHGERVPAEAIQELIASPEAECRKVAWGALFRGERPPVSGLDSVVEEPDPEVRRWMLWTHARWRDQELLPNLRKALHRGAEEDAEAVLLLGALATPEDAAALRAVAERGSEAAVLGLGAAGRFEDVPFILEALEDSKMADAAEQAFLAITGEPVLREDVPGTEGELEQPSAEDARESWGKIRGEFEPGKRWRTGLAEDDLTLADAVARLDLEGAFFHWLRHTWYDRTGTPWIDFESMTSKRHAP